MSLLLLVSAALAADNAALFDGTTSMRLGTTLNPGTSFTVEAWVRFDNTVATQTVVQAIDATNKSTFSLFWWTTFWLIEIEDIDANEGGSCTQGFDAWCPTDTLTTANMHLALVVTPTAIRLYKDGNLFGNQAISTTVSGFGTDIWQVGADDGGASQDQFYGAMDELRVWSGIRTGAEIQCLMNWGLTGSEAGLHALYSMDENNGATSVPDATSTHAAATTAAQFIASPFGLTPSTGGDIPCFDFDGDGQPQSSDCDDTNPAVSAPTTYYLDSDSDGFGDPNFVLSACTAPSDHVADNSDCDDARADINPLASEVCDGIDNDCDTLIDNIGCATDTDTDTDTTPTDTDTAPTDTDTAPTDTDTPPTDSDTDSDAPTDTGSTPGPTDTGANVDLPKSSARAPDGSLQTGQTEPRKGPAGCGCTTSPSRSAPWWGLAILAWRRRLRC